MRAWLEILGERHPGVTWVPGEDGTAEDGSVSLDSLYESESLAA